MIEISFACCVFWSYCATISESERPFSSFERASEPIKATFSVVGTLFGATFFTVEVCFADENPWTNSIEKKPTTSVSSNKTDNMIF